MEPLFVYSVTERLFYRVGEDVVLELKKDPRIAIFKAKRGSKPYLYAVCHLMDTIPFELAPLALEAILPFTSQATSDPVMAVSIIIAIGKINRILQSDWPNDTRDTSPMEKPILAHWAGLINCLKRSFKAHFSEDAFVTTSQSLRTRFFAEFATFLMSMGKNKTLAKRFFAEEEMVQLPVRLWLLNIGDTKPGRCPMDVLDALWTLVKHGDIAERLHPLLLTVADNDLRRIAYACVSELRARLRNTRSETVVFRIKLTILLMVDEEYRAAFYRLGGIGSLVKAMLSLHYEAFLPNVFKTLNMFINQLEILFRGPNTVSMICEAIENGLFVLLVKFGSMLPDASGEYRKCGLFFSGFLTRCLVFDSVVSAAVKGMAEIEDRDFLRTFASASFWIDFRALLLERAVFKVELDRSTRSWGRTMSCNSCGTILVTSGLKKCAACQEAMYCSEDCQKTDWKEGSHKEACSESVQMNAPLKPADVHFLTEFIQYELRRNTSDIKAQNLVKAPYGRLSIWSQCEMLWGHSFLLCSQDQFNGVLTNEDAEDLHAVPITIIYALGKNTRLSYVVRQKSCYATAPRVRPEFSGDLPRAAFRQSSYVVTKLADDGELEKPEDATTLNGTSDEIDAILRYIMEKKGLEDSRSSVAKWRYTWDELRTLVKECRQSDSWPFESGGAFSPEDAITTPEPEHPNITS